MESAFKERFCAFKFYLKSTKFNECHAWRNHVASYQIVHYMPRKARPQRAASYRELYAPKRIFSYNTTSKNHGRRQPCRGFLSCLAEKSSALECFAVLKVRFFLTRTSRGRRNTGCISRTMDSLWGKRFLQNHVNP